MENEIHSVILEFVQQQPAWQQDLFRRVLTQQSITPTDLQEVLSVLKAEQGVTPGDDLRPEPVSTGDVPFREVPNLRAILLSISETQDVNRLIPDQDLPFAPRGITLIYGDNGSGKSGYCRILKQLCRARRDGRERVLGDVFAVGSQRPAQAKLSYSVGGEVKEHRWVDGGVPPKELSRLTVFDAQAAPIYVDRQNQIEFLPEGLDVLPRVGRALQSLAETLDQEIRALSELIQQPVIPARAGTVVGAFVDRLEFGSRGPLPSTEEIEQAARWSEADDQTLGAVREALATMSQPAKAAARCRRMKTALDRARRVLGDATANLRDEAIQELRKIQDEARSAREAAKISASGSFGDDPFGPHISTASWRNLFRYARAFSEVVYPGEPFPVVGLGRKCVLCQQPLSEPASDRLTRFNAFVQQTASRDADERERVLSIRLQSVRELRIPPGADLESDLGEYSETGPEAQTLVTSTSAFCAALRQRQDGFKQEAASWMTEALPPLPDFQIESLADSAASLDAEAKEYDQALQDENHRRSQERERDELEARQILNQQLPHVLGRRNLLDRLHRLRKCRAACDTTAISRKASSLREEHLGGGFQQRLLSEADKLGVRYLPLKVSSKSERGASFVGVELDQTAGARTASVLSEGEFRVLALACFLAEVAGIPNHDGIIVDDPVSSLDHRHIRQVARRLVSEATVRPQVIIFTHNLAFYCELLEAALEAGVAVEAHWIRRTGGTRCGEVSINDAPWQVKKVKERLATLEQMVRDTPKQEECSDAAYILHLKTFYGMLRETWERLVEERLLNGVVGRFELGVKTQSLKGVIVEDADYQRVFSAMTKASRYSGHDAAALFQTSYPDPSEMRCDLDLLRDYEHELRKRCAQVEVRRRALEDPVKAKSA